jgi:hypothetical protein
MNHIFFWHTLSIMPLRTYETELSALRKRGRATMARQELRAKNSFFHDINIVIQKAYIPASILHFQLPARCRNPAIVYPAWKSDPVRAIKESGIRE